LSQITEETYEAAKKQLGWPKTCPSPEVCFVLEKTPDLELVSVWVEKLIEQNLI
jgi:hypothetical protein